MDPISVCVRFVPPSPHSWNSFISLCSLLCISSLPRRFSSPSSSHLSPSLLWSTYQVLLLPSLSITRLAMSTNQPTYISAEEPQRTSNAHESHHFQRARLQEGQLELGESLTRELAEQTQDRKEVSCSSLSFVSATKLRSLQQILANLESGLYFAIQV